MSQSPVMWRFSGNQMKRWRTKANISREQPAAASNYSPDTIKAMEQGARMPTPESSTWQTSCAARRGR
ncbi:helix-turn-helix domain-containing protein [Streptomyces sp. NPDC097107]|uniref:helix-turn-helix domain-containing protein n=1 Tax=Streptomyces sp. NPDC097107 TaxID=3366089 RepID=UPI003829C5AB